MNPLSKTSKQQVATHSGNNPNNSPNSTHQQDILATESGYAFSVENNDNSVENNDNSKNPLHAAKTQETSLVTKSLQPEKRKGILSRLSSSKDKTIAYGGSMSPEWNIRAVVESNGARALTEITSSKNKDKLQDFLKKASSLANKSNRTTQDNIDKEIQKLQNMLLMNPALLTIINCLYLTIGSIKNNNTHRELPSGITPRFEIFREGGSIFLASYKKDTRSFIVYKDTSELIDAEEGTGLLRINNNTRAIVQDDTLGEITEEILLKLINYQQSNTTESGSSGTEYCLTASMNNIQIQSNQDYIKISIIKAWTSEVKRILRIGDPQQKAKAFLLAYNEITLKLNEIQKKYFLKEVMSPNILHQLVVYAESTIHFNLFCETLSFSPANLASVLLNLIQVEQRARPSLNFNNVYSYGMAKIVQIYATYSDKINDSLTDTTLLDTLKQIFSDKSPLLAHDTNANILNIPYDYTTLIGSGKDLINEDNVQTFKYLLKQIDVLIKDISNRKSAYDAFENKVNSLINGNQTTGPTNPQEDINAILTGNNGLRFAEYYVVNKIRISTEGKDKLCKADQIKLKKALIKIFAADKLQGIFSAHYRDNNINSIDEEKFNYIQKLIMLSTLGQQEDVTRNRDFRTTTTTQTSLLLG